MRSLIEGSFYIKTEADPLVKSRTYCVERGSNMKTVKNSLSNSSSSNKSSSVLLFETGYMGSDFL